MNGIIQVIGLLCFNGKFFKKFREISNQNDTLIQPAKFLNPKSKWMKKLIFELLRSWGSNKSNRVRRKNEIKFSIPQADVTLRLQKRFWSLKFLLIFTIFGANLVDFHIFTRSWSFYGRTYGFARSFMVFCGHIAVKYCSYFWNFISDIFKNFIIF